MTTDPRKNWIKKFNEDTGNFVYFNVETYEPVARVPRDQINNIWEERFDTKYNRPFYWNPATNQSKWALKYKRGHPDADELSKAASSPPQVQLQACQAESEWKEVWDEETQRTAKISSFWHNEITHESFWIKPTEVGAALDNPWQELIDETTSRKYYYNIHTGVSQWEKPVPFESKSQTSPEILRKQSDDIKEINDDGETPYALPWEMLRDPSTGRVFFYNREDGRSQWERPEELPLLEKVEQDPLCLVDPAEEERSMFDNDWEEFIDENTGQTYYHNKNTGVSQWTHPQKTDATVETHSNLQKQNEPKPPKGPPPISPSKMPPNQPEIEPPKIPKEDLEPNWVEIHDPEHKRVYYYNTETGISQWIHPATMRASFKQERDLKHTLDPDNVWIEMNDEKSGRSYFYNKLTGESRWTLKPTSNSKDEKTKDTSHLSLPGDDSLSSSIPSSAQRKETEESSMDGGVLSKSSIPLETESVKNISVVESIPDDLLPENVFSKAETIAHESKRKRRIEGGSVSTSLSETHVDVPQYDRKITRENQDISIINHPRERTFAVSKTSLASGMQSEETLMRNSPLATESLRRYRGHSPNKSIASVSSRSSRSVFDHRYTRSQVESSFYTNPKGYLMEGYMRKRARNSYQWQRRYFTLSSQALKYYLTHEDAAMDKRPLAIIDLKQIRNIEKIDNDPEPLHEYESATDFRVLGIGTIGILCLLRADTSSSRDIWIESLMNGVERVAGVSPPTISKNEGNLTEQRDMPVGVQNGITRSLLASEDTELTKTGALFVECNQAHLAKDKGELSYSVGDIIRVIEAPKFGNWWIGQIQGEEAYGKFRRDHVVRMQAMINSQEKTGSNINRVQVFGLDEIINSSALPGEPFPSTLLLSELIDEVRSMNKRNHNFKAEICAMRSKVYYNEQDGSRQGLLYNRNKDEQAGFLHFSQFLYRLQRNPLLVSKIGHSLEDELQLQDFFTILFTSIFDEISTSSHFLFNLMKEINSVDHADPTARTFSVMQKSFSTALFSRAECISYLKKLLKSVHTAVYTWTSSIENHLNEELASEVMSAFIDSSMQESALEATPSSIHAMVQTLAMSQGSTSVREFIVSHLLSHMIKLFYKENSDLATEVEKAFKICEMNNMFVEHVPLRRKCESMVSKFIEASSIIDIDKPEKIPEACNLVVISIAGLHKLHRAMFKCLHGSSEALPEVLHDLFKVLGPPKSLKEGTSQDKLIVMSLHGDDLKPRHIRGIDEMTLALLQDAMELVEKPDKVEPDREHLLLAKLSTQREIINRSCELHRQILDTRVLMQEYFATLVLEREELNSMYHTRSTSLNGRNPSKQDPVGSEPYIEEKVAFSEIEANPEEMQNDSSKEKQNGSALANLLATVYSPLKLESL